MTAKRKCKPWIGVFKSDSDVDAIARIMSRVFALGRRNSLTPEQVAENIETKRNKINLLIDIHKQQALNGRQV